LNEYIKGRLENDPRLSRVFVRGEISNFTRHSSGHLYFSIKDEGGQIRAVMFRSAAASMSFVPEDGMKVLVTGSVSVYVKSGAYQIYVTSLRPDGLGALYLAYERLKRKLEEEGLFSEERKRPLPQFPKKIGVITSPTGAAIRDILHITGRRYPLADILLYPALVQGDGAPQSLLSGLCYFANTDIDVIIIGRGGGSIEDLWAFNNEAVARQIAEMPMPVISAVGHETDFTICDFVADLRAPTPSAAAELAVPDIRELYLSLDAIAERAASALSHMAKQKKERLLSLEDRLRLLGEGRLLDGRRQSLSHLYERLKAAFTVDFERKRAALSAKAEKAEALSPLRVLCRGYCVAQTESGTLTSVDGANVGQPLSLTLSDGKIFAIVEKKEKHSNG
jgi:exodeoxyribonuclease VII large subunit